MTMSNPLYQQMQPQNNLQQMMQRFQQFKRTFSGNPQQQVQQLLNTGRVSQAQYNQAFQMAQQFQRMMGGR